MKLKNSEASNINIISFVTLIIGIILIKVACYFFFVSDPAHVDTNILESIKSLLSFGYGGVPLVLKHYILPLFLMVLGLIITMTGGIMLLLTTWKEKMEASDDLEEKDNFVFQGIMITISIVFLLFFAYLLVSLIRLYMI